MHFFCIASFCNPHHFFLHTNELFSKILRLMEAEQAVEIFDRHLLDLAAVLVTAGPTAVGEAVRLGPPEEALSSGIGLRWKGEAAPNYRYLLLLQHLAAWVFVA